MKQELGAEFVAELVRAFLDHLAAALKAVALSLPRGDLASIAKESHSLKGSSRQLEVDAIATICAQIETSAKDGRLDQVQGLARRLEEEGQAVDRELRAYLGALSS